MPNGSGVILPSPKKVKTVSIRPDMSIVGSANAGQMTVAQPQPHAPSALRRQAGKRAGNLV